MKKGILLLTLLLCLVLGTLLFASCVGSSEPTPKTEAKTGTATDPATGSVTGHETESATDAAQTEPTTDPITAGVTGHEHVWDDGKVTKEAGCDPSSKAIVNGEMTYTCTVCGETKTEEIPGDHTWNDGKVVDAATCSAEGLRLYTCTVCNKKRQEKIPKSDAHTFKAGDSGRILTPPTSETQDGEREKICTSCGTSVFYPVTYAEYTDKINALKKDIQSFSNNDFGGRTFCKTRQDLIDADENNGHREFALPPVSPTAGQHPRVLINESDLAAINAELNDPRSEAARAEYLSYLSNPTNGFLGLATERNDGFHNFDAGVLNEIQALALEYQLTGNQIVGYQAIKGILNYLKTMDFQEISGDQERQFGFVMYVAACVYDWCHDLLTSVDKLRIVSGVQHNVLSGTDRTGEAWMEIGFPPSKQHGIAGHGCEFQLLRDYLAFAIAIYDEYPGWWEYVAGRIYQEFVPTRNEYYKAGMYPQGVSVYIRIRFSSDLFSAWLLKKAVGEMPYDEDGMKQVVRTYYCYELPNSRGFASGDNSVPVDDFIVGGRATLISSYLFNDATLRAQLEYFEQSYNVFTTSFSFSASVTEYLICSSNGVKAAADRHEELPLIQYNGGWLGQIIARNSWGDDQASVLMKIGCRTMGNHDHADAGSFQIFYKTTLAGDTGAYDKYGDEHFKKYHQATIAHNSLLINGSGQKQPGENGNTDRVLKTDYYKTGTVTGYEAGYADEAKTTPTYAYIAGNITPAYYEINSTSSSTVNEVTRRMLTVYDTKNVNVPMFFFVFDNVDAKSASYQKTFLLHVPVEPTVDEAKKSVTVSANGAKLVLQSVFGGDSFEAIGGKNNNYNVNGTQLTPTDGGNDGFWGRVEISTSGSKTSQLLNVMYVCDSDKRLNLTAKEIETDVVKGAVLGKVAAIFVTNETRRSTAFSFTSTGSDLTYYVSGVKAGNWTVSVDGQSQTVTATEDGGLLVFSAGSGTVTLTPQ